MNTRCLLFTFAFAALPYSAFATPLPTASATNQLTPKQAEQFIHAAARMYAQGDYKNAVGFYQRALTVEPGNIEGIAGMGDAMVASGLPLDATILYQQLMNLRPNDLRGPLGMASAYNRAGQPARGLDWVNLAIQKGATGVTSVLEKGLSLDLLGRPKDAQQVYSAGMKQSPNSIDLLKSMAISLSLTEDYPAALQLLQTISNEPGQTTAVREALATVYALSNQPDQAMKIIGTQVDKPEETAAKAAYYAALSRMDTAGKARAAHLGQVNGSLPEPAPAPQTVQNDIPSPPPGAVLAADLPGPVLTQPVITPEKRHKPGKPQMITLPDDAADAVAVTGIANTGEAPAAGPTTNSNPNVRAAPLPAGEHVWVQLGLSPSRGKLEQQWQWAYAKAQGGLAGLAPYVQPALVNGKTMLRLLVGGYTDGSTASSLIKRLHALKIPGFVNRNGLGADPLYP